MKKQYTKKQILEAITYWKNVLKRMNESFEYEDAIDYEFYKKQMRDNPLIQQIAKKAGMDKKLTTTCLREMLADIIRNNCADGIVVFSRAVILNDYLFRFVFTSKTKTYKSGYKIGGFNEDECKKEFPKYMMDEYGIEIDDVYVDTVIDDIEEYLSIEFRLYYDDEIKNINKFIKTIKANAKKAKKSKAIIEFNYN